MAPAAAPHAAESSEAKQQLRGASAAAVNWQQKSLLLWMDNSSNIFRMVQTEASANAISYGFSATKFSTEVMPSAAVN